MRELNYRKLMQLVTNLVNGGAEIWNADRQSQLPIHHIYLVSTRDNLTVIYPKLNSCYLKLQLQSSNDTSQKP